MRKIGSGMATAVKVRQLDYETGEEIGVYETIKDAAEDNFINRYTISDAFKNNEGFLKNKKLRFEVIN